ASAEAGGLLGHAPGGGDVRDRVDAVRGPDSRLDPLARRDRRDRGARRGPAPSLLGRRRRAVPAVVGGARGLPQVLQALPAVHPDRRARGWRTPDRGGRARGHELLSGWRCLLIRGSRVRSPDGSPKIKHFHSAALPVRPVWWRMVAFFTFRKTPSSAVCPRRR